MAQPLKNAFNLTSATLMIAPFGVDPFSLTPAANSVGMVRDVAIAQDTAVIELRNGVQQSLIDVKKGEVKVQITAAVFEYTAQNLFNAIGLNRTPVQPKFGKLNAAVVAAATSVTVNTGVGTGVPGDTATALAVIGDVPSGSLVLLQRTGAGLNDYVFPSQTTGAASLVANVMTLTLGANYAIPAGMSFAAGDNMWVVNSPPVGGLDELDLFGVKITGTASNYERPITVVLPKVKIVKGFALNFNEKDYGSMPFELMPMLMTASEAATGRLVDIGTTRMGVAYIGA